MYWSSCSATRSITTCSRHGGSAYRHLLQADIPHPIDCHTCDGFDRLFEQTVDAADCLVEQEARREMAALKRGKGHDAELLGIAQGTG